MSVQTYLKWRGRDSRSTVHGTLGGPQVTSGRSCGGARPMDGQEWIRCMDQARAVEMVGGRRGRHGRWARLADRELVVPLVCVNFEFLDRWPWGDRERPRAERVWFGVWTAPWVNHKNLSSLGPYLVGPCLVPFFFAK